MVGGGEWWLVLVVVVEPIGQAEQYEFTDQGRVDKINYLNYS